MPLYDYACTKCGHTVEVRHGFDEAYDAPCSVCGAPVRRVFNAAPVLFKGSGFYVTDSRRASGAAKSEKPKGESESADAKPADTKAADTKPASTASKPSEPPAA